FRGYQDETRHPQHGYETRRALIARYVAPLRGVISLRASTTQSSLCFARERLTDQVSHKTANDDVFAEFCNLTVEQIPDGYVGIFYEPLLEQANRAVKLLEFSLDNFVSNILGFAFHLRLVDFAFRFDEITGHIASADIERVCRRNVQGDVFHKLAKDLVSGHEIGLTINLDQHSNLPLEVNVRSHHSFFCRARRLFSSAGNSLGAQDRFRFLQIAAALHKSTLAIHKS